MPLCLFLLRVKIVKSFIVARLSEDEVPLFLPELRLLDLGDLPLGLLLQLVRKWNEQVPLPDAELLRGRVQAHLREEALILNR